MISPSSAASLASERGADPLETSLRQLKGSFLITLAAMSKRRILTLGWYCGCRCLGCQLGWLATGSSDHCDLAADGDYHHLADTAAFKAYLGPLWKTDWFVYAKPPFAGPEQVLAYLSRYTHRVAISNSRLISADAYAR